MKSLSTLGIAMLAAMAGAGTMYLLDPVAGARRRQRLAERLMPWREEAVEEDDGLEPLAMTPEPLERQASHGRMLPSLAMATPVALAVGVGAAWWRRRDDGGWLH
jgi:hypothetical protein